MDDIIDVEGNISSENSVISSLSAMVPIVSTLHTLTSINGREIELRNNGTYIQWHYVDEQTWTDLVALADITGPQGPAELICLQPTYDLTIPNASDYTLTDMTTVSSKGTALTWSGYPNYGVLIGDGVSKVKISFMANLYQNTETASTRFSVVIKKNNVDVNYIWVSGIGQDKYVHASNITVTNVEAGDYIEFIIKSNGNPTSGTRDKVKSMTRIVVESVE